MSLNILITSASRKVWLVEAFKKALLNEGVEGKVISVETNPLSAALYLSDKHYLVPASSRKNFIPEIIKICRKDKIKLIVPTRDGELMLFARHRDIFQRLGISLLVSSPVAVDTCQDKYKFFLFLRLNGIPTPLTFLPHEVNPASLRYPLIVKPRFGSGSKDVFKVENKPELKIALSKVTNPIIQEHAEGKEYTLDLFSDFKGRILTVVARLRMEVVSGESYKTITIRDKIMQGCARLIAERLPVIGPATFQCIKNGKSIRFIEANLRFGGASALSMRAGADTPLLILRLLRGKKNIRSSDKFKNGLIMLRYTRDIFIFKRQVYK